MPWGSYLPRLRPFNLLLLAGRPERPMQRTEILFGVAWKSPDEDSSNLEENQQVFPCEVGDLLLRILYSLMVLVFSKIMFVTFSGAGPPFSQLNLMPKSSSIPPDVGVSSSWHSPTSASLRNLCQCLHSTPTFPQTICFFQPNLTKTTKKLEKPTKLPYNLHQLIDPSGHTWVVGGRQNESTKGNEATLPGTDHSAGSWGAQQAILQRVRLKAFFLVVVFVDMFFLHLGDSNDLFLKPKTMEKHR